MLTYILEVSLCWMVFYSVYYLLLSKETFFKLNRTYLLLTSVLGLLIPLTDLSWFLQEPVEEVMYFMQPVTVGVEKLEMIVVSDTSNSSFHISALLESIYWFGVALFCLRLLYGLYQLFSFFKNARIARSNGFYIATSGKVHSPFSFLNVLFWSDKLSLTEAERQNIFQHEEAHIFQRHSLDVFFMEALGVIFWCSPFIYLYKNSLKTVHEYLADDYVLRSANKKQYGHLLLRQSQSGPQVVLTNAMFNSQLKKRIEMMTKNKSSRKAAAKYLALLPVIAILSLAFSNASFVSPPIDSGFSLTQSDTVPSGDEIFKKVDVMPMFPGCDGITYENLKNCSSEKLLEFVYKNLKYPSEAKSKGVEGMVVVKFIVEKNGKISGAEMVRSVGSGTDEEVLRVVNMMPDWIPGKQNGQGVRTQFVLPVKFQLPADKNEPKTESDSGNEEIFKVVEEMPHFPGCDDVSPDEKKKCADQKMLDFIYQNIKYPKEAKENGIEGMVVIKFIIEKDGSITNADIIRGIGGGCDQEALRVVESMPNWAPGKQRGRLVRVQFNLPIRFKLDNKPAKNNEPVSGELKAYPNPAQNSLDVEFRAATGAVTLRIYDMTGREVYQKSFSAYDGTYQKVDGIDISKMQKGNLFVSLFDAKGKTITTTQVVIQ